MKRLASVRKGITVPSSKSTKPVENGKIGDELPNDTEAGLLYIQGLVPTEKFGCSLPPIVLKHQIYSIIKDKTAVDREVMAMRDNGRIRLIKLESGSDDYAIVSTDHYCKLIEDKLGASSSPLRVKVINSLLPQCVDVSVSKAQLTEQLHFTDEEISVLVKHGFLLVRDVGKNSSWWFTLPGISVFKKDFTKGRTSVKQILRRTKHKEILQKDLESKRTSSSRLPMEYYIHDLIGAEVVESIDTSSGPLLKLIV